MKKCAAMLAALMFILLAVTGLAQEYYTLPEIREQAAEGWHETYTDKYGRSVQVDIDLEVFGGKTVPVLKVGFPLYGELRLKQNNPYNTVENVRKSGGRRTHIYRTYGERIDRNEAYGKEYDNDLTLQEMYDYLNELLEQQQISDENFILDQPCLFDVLCNVNQTTGEIVASAFYVVDLWPKLRELPILTHSMASYKKRGSPDYNPRLSFMMRNRDEYSLFVGTMEEKETISQDIPLCSVNKVISSIEEEIKKGYIQKVFSLRFGYSLYNDPSIPNNQKKSAFESEYYYAVPSWVIECIYMTNPIETFTYSYEASLEKDPDTSERSTDGFKIITINAQTGKMLDPMDTSKNGWVGMRRTRISMAGQGRSILISRCLERKQRQLSRPAGENLRNTILKRMDHLPKLRKRESGETAYRLIRITAFGG